MRAASEDAARFVIALVTGDEKYDKKFKQRYHWLVISLVLLEMIVYGGVINSFSVFTIPVCEALGVSRGEFSVAGMPYTVMCFVSTLISGYMIKRIGYKRGTMISLVLAAVGMAILSCANSLWMVAISRVVFALGYGFCFTAGAVRLVRDWFWKHQGLMIGLVTMGTGIGGSLMTVLLTAVEEKADWRAASLVAGGILLLIAVGYVLLKDRPEEVGLKQYGFGEQQKTAKKQRQADGRDWAGLSLQEQMKRPAFYLMNFCVLISCACIYITSTVLVPHFRDLNYSGAEAAGYQSVMMLTVAASKLISGGMCDRFGAKPVSVVCMLCAIIGQFMLSFVTGPILCYVSVFVFAVCMCMTSSVVPLLAASLFCYQGSANSNGVFISMAALAALISMPVGNYGYDLMGSYMPVFRIASIVNLGVLGLFFVLFALAKRDKKRFLEQKV